MPLDILSKETGQRTAPRTSIRSDPFRSKALAISGILARVIVLDYGNEYYARKRTHLFGRMSNRHCVQHLVLHHRNKLIIKNDSRPCQTSEHPDVDLYPKVRRRLASLKADYPYRMPRS